MKYSYCFLGQNATTGTVNHRTGLTSMYGEIIAFSTRARRDRFISEYYDNNPSVFAKACSRATARQYNLGSSVFDFEEYMHFVDLNVNENYDSYFQE